MGLVRCFDGSGVRSQLNAVAIERHQVHRVLAGAICPALPPPIDRARSVLRRIDGRAHGVHHLWSRGRLLRSVLIPWSASHDAEPRSRMRPSGFDYHGLACLRPET
jgi:hypothetical protein